MKDLTQYTIDYISRSTIYEEIPTGQYIGDRMQFKSNPIYCTFDKFFVTIIDGKIYIRKNQQEERIFKVDYNSEFIYKVMKTKVVTSSNNNLFNFIAQNGNVGDLFYFQVAELLNNIYETVKQTKL